MRRFFFNAATILLVFSGSCRAQVENLCDEYDSCFDCAPHVTSEDYVQFKYRACYDQLNIVPDHVECNAFETDNFTFPNETLKAGEYKHYHWTLTTYALINHEDGAQITFEVVPEYGYPQMFTKAQILYGGMPMCQMFETKAGTEGEHTDTWPFPNKETGALAQGPEFEIAELERSNTASSQTYSYPGSVFSEVTWGFNASGYDSDRRPKVHTISIPHVSYGGYFLSVYAGDEVDARYSISVKAERTIDIEEDVSEYATKQKPPALTVSESFLSNNCSEHKNSERCEAHCCEWIAVGTDDSNSYRRRMTESGKPRFLNEEDYYDYYIPEDGECVQASADVLCVSEKISDGSTDVDPRPTVLVSYQTLAEPTNKYSLYFVEMNDCASQMDDQGHEYCWDIGWFTDGNRLDALREDGGMWNPPNWQSSCGTGTPPGQTVAPYTCDPTYSEPGHCNFDGAGSWTGNPKETTWSNAYDCIVWTPNGLRQHGLPVSYNQYQTYNAETDSYEWTAITAAIKEDLVTTQGDITTLYENFDSFPRLKGIVTDYDKGIALNINDESLYDGFFSNLPPSSWVTSEIHIYNNVTYFFNVLIQKENGDYACYDGTSARTKFWRQTTLLPVEMIEIIAGVVVVALVALLVPFILTKRKITAHLRDVYESHKYKNHLKGVEERVLEQRAKRNAQKVQSEQDSATLKTEDDIDNNGQHHEKQKNDHHHHHHHHKHGHHHHHHKHQKKVHKHQIQPITNSKEESKDNNGVTKRSADM
jgi:hypothetical protein